MELWLKILLGILAGLWALSGALWLYLLSLKSMKGSSRVTEVALDQLRHLQKDQTTIISELLAHRTLAETGNYHIAGQMLSHSNAHDERDLGNVYAPPEPDNELPIQGPHVSPELMFGEEGEEPPLPGQE